LIFQSESFLLKNNQFILILLLSVFLLRVVGIFDGLPAAYNSTEYFLAKTALSMGARQSLDPMVYVYPTLYTYFLLFIYVIIYVIGNLAAVFNSTIDFAIQFLIDPSVFYLTGRITSVLLSVITVFIFYSHTRKLFSEITARFAGITAGLGYYFGCYSRFAVADTMLIFFSTLATLSVLQAYFNPSKRNYIWAGLFTGLAIGTKYNAGFLMLGLLTAFILILIEGRSKNYWQHGIVLTLSFLTGFLIFNPLWLFSFSDFFEGYRLVSAQMNTAVSLYSGKNYVWEMSQIISHELLIGVGFFIASVVAVLRKKPFHLILLLPMLVTFIYVGSWQKKGVDYLFAIFPAWILMFSLWLEELWLKLEKYRNLRILLIVLIFVPSLLMNIYQNVIALNRDTREQATEWIMKTVGKSERISYDHYTFDLGLFDVHRYTDYGAGSAQLPEVIKERVLNYVNHPRNVSNVSIQTKTDTQMTDPDNPYDAQAAQYGRKSLAQLRNEGVTYLITNSWFYQPYLDCDIEKFTPIMKNNIEGVRGFYKDIEEMGKKVKVFQPDFWKPGPMIEVYDISKEK
jgi:4-amino-4-deoxy-L-arabinose transferase-like glycosyltransferase